MITHYTKHTHSQSDKTTYITQYADATLSAKDIQIVSLSRKCW